MKLTTLDKNKRANKMNYDQLLMTKRETRAENLLCKTSEFSPLRSESSEIITSTPKELEYSRVKPPTVSRKNKKKKKMIISELQ